MVVKRRSIVEIFDCSNIEHMQQLKTLLRTNVKTRAFNATFADAAYPVGWRLALLLKVVQYIIDLILKNSEPSK